eukprot:EST42213.1 Centrin [Spironucleus salmonicida]
MPKQHHIKRPLTQEQRNELVEAFLLFVDSPKIFDQITQQYNVAGYITARELKVVLRALGFEPTREEIKALIATQDAGSGQLQLQGFLNIIENKLSTQDSKEEMLKAFRIFDTQDKGRISIDDLKRIAAELGVQLDELDLQEMIDEADRDCDGLVNEEEFYRVQKK